MTRPYRLIRTADSAANVETPSGTPLGSIERVDFVSGRGTYWRAYPHPDGAPLPPGSFPTRTAAALALAQHHEAGQ